MRSDLIIEALVHAGQKVGAEVLSFLRTAEEKRICALCLARFLEGVRSLEGNDLRALFSEFSAVRSCDVVRWEYILDVEERALLSETYGIDAPVLFLLAVPFYEQTGLCMYPTHLEILLLLRGSEETGNLVDRYERYLEDVLQDASRRKVGVWELGPAIYEFWEKEVLKLIPVLAPKLTKKEIILEEV